MIVNDPQHLYSHLNYLYRTDRAQKWTCEETAGNRDLIVSSAFAGLVERQKLHDEALARIKESLKPMTLCDGSRCHRLLETTLVMLDREVEAAPRIDAIFPSFRTLDARYTVLVAVVHADQREMPCHLHLLAKFEGKRRRKFECFDDAVADALARLHL